MREAHPVAFWIYVAIKSFVALGYFGILLALLYMIWKATRK